MKKRVSLILALILAFSLTACGGKQNTADPEFPAPNTTVADPARQDEKTEILVWTFLNPDDESGRGKVLRDCKDMYETLYPNVKVTIESQQWDTMTAKFFAAAQTGTAPDVIWVNGLDLGEAIQLGVVEPFENMFLKDWSAEEISDIDDARFQYGEKGGRHYQIHLSTNVYGIVYRADIFEKFGVDPNFESWDELIQAAKKMTYVDEETGMQVYGLGTGYSTENAESSYLRACLFTEYGDIVDENGKANWDSEVGREALQKQIEMIDSDKITPESAISQSLEDVYADFCAGKYAMILSGGVRIPTLRSQCGFDPDVIKLMKYPDIGEKTGKGLAAGWNVCVWSGSQHKEEAGRFIEVLCSPEMDYEWVVEAGQIPLRKSTLETAADFISRPENEFLAVSAELLIDHAVTYNSEYVISGYTKDLNRAMQLAYVEGYSVEEALAVTAEEFNERTGN